MKGDYITSKILLGIYEYSCATWQPCSCPEYLLFPYHCLRCYSLNPRILTPFPETEAAEVIHVWLTGSLQDSVPWQSGWGRKVRNIGKNSFRKLAKLPGNPHMKGHVHLLHSCPPLSSLGLHAHTHVHTGLHACIGRPLKENWLCSKCNQLIGGFEAIYIFKSSLWLLCEDYAVGGQGYQQGDQGW